MRVPLLTDAADAESACAGASVRAAAAGALGHGVAGPVAVQAGGARVVRETASDLSTPTVDVGRYEFARQLLLDLPDNLKYADWKSKNRRF